MKLKTRLIISFFLIIIVPVFFVGAAVIGFGHYQLKVLDREYGIEGTTYESLTNPVRLLSKMTGSIYDHLRLEVEADPGVMHDIAYLDSVNLELNTKYSYMVIKQNGHLKYLGESKIDTDVMNVLPEYGDNDAESGADAGVYIGGDVQALIKQIDYISENDEQGSIYIITSIEGLIPQLKGQIFELLFIIILILVMTSAILTTWIYRGFITPLKKLKAATNHIKEGDLDFTLEVDGNDEISELCVDFEEMRKRLKDSAEEKVEYDSQNKELISNISHDLKTPITAVKGYVEGIMDGVADTPEKMNRYIRTIYNKANEMDRLINELTFYSKIDTNRIPYSFGHINVYSFFGDCAEELELELEEKNISLGYFNYVDNEVEIIADAEQLKRVINNVVSNSVKYMDKKKGFISIRIRDVGDFIQIEIEDNGKGIAAQDVTHIFDRFYRTDTSRNSSKGGSGIGLSIVKKIVEDHGGKIWATSKEETGTTMFFVLRKYQEVKIDE